MALIKDNQIAKDLWTVIGEDAPVPGDTRVIVSLARWQAERETLSTRNCPIGICLAAGETPDQIKDDLERFDIIALDFPKFKDGRAFSYARLLRERYGYKGEIRAVGDVGRDQLLYMARCGFDAFALNDGLTLEDFQDAMGEQSVFYQSASDARATAVEQRGEN